MSEGDRGGHIVCLHCYVKNIYYIDSLPSLTADTTLPHIQPCSQVLFLGLTCFLLIGLGSV